MTRSEQKRFIERFQAKRTSRIVQAQNGYAEVFQAANHSTQFDAPSGTREVDPADQGIDGDANREGVDSEHPIYGAISILQKHIESLGNESLLDLWSSTSDALKKTVSIGDSIQKAVPNPDGPTEDVRHVPDNANSSRPGSHGYISVSELEAGASKLVSLNSRIVNVERL
jgi:hypothetical protein